MLLSEDIHLLKSKKIKWLAEGFNNSDTKNSDIKETIEEFK